MNNETPETIAAMNSRITDLEQQLKLADEGASHLAQRCLDLEKELQSYLAAHPQREMHIDSPTLLQPLLYFDAGFGMSEKDTISAPDYMMDKQTGFVTATFELPMAAQSLRFDPGELPCCINDLIFSDDRILCRPANGLDLHENTLFLGDDPNYRLEGVSHYPAGTKLSVSYYYFPLETLADEPLFRTVLSSVRYFQHILQQTKENEESRIQELNQTLSAQQQSIQALETELARLREENTTVKAKYSEYETSLETILASTSWKLTAPVRSLMGLFHRGN